MMDFLTCLTCAAIGLILGIVLAPAYVVITNLF
jgi:hypothetical protein